MRLMIVGFGNVGQGFAEILHERSMEIADKYGVRFKVVAIFDSRGGATSSRGLDLEKALLIKRSKGTVAAYPVYGKLGIVALDVVEEMDANLLIEVTPTNVEDGEPGLSHIMTALKSGKCVVTTNKGPLVVAFQEVMRMAEESGTIIKFSGTVGGAIPIIDFAKKCIVANNVLSVEGILNGTTNYILTRMSNEEIPFKKALVEAQKIGIAEADPSYDVEGVDTACKLVILANTVMGKSIKLWDVEIEGITHITLEKINEAKKKGKRIKLIGSIDGGVSVKPRLISREHPICVDGVLNAITFHTELAGDFTLIGKGAGRRETASSVLRDVIEIAKQVKGRRSV